MAKPKDVGTVGGKVAASGLAGLVAAYVGSEMLQETVRAKNDRSALGTLCLTIVFSIWACWEVLQVRQHLGLTPEIEDE